MSNLIRRTLYATAVITVSLAAGAGHVSAGGDDTPWDGDDLPFDAPGDPPPPPPDPEVNPDLDLPDLDIVNPTLPPEPPLPPPCSAVDTAAFGVTIADNGDGTAFVQIGYFDAEDACNADVTVTSYATNVDDSASAVVATDQTTVNDLEAAALGDGWFEADIAVDPCFAKVVVDVDGTELETDQFGLGCSISTKDFEGDPWNAAINLVHVDSWTPDHVFEVSSDDMVVWDELPSGDYTVSEFDGAEDGTTISIDDGAPAVAHAGEAVPVTVGQSVLVTNPDLPTDTTEPEDEPEDEPETSPRTSPTVTSPRPGPR
ncbi:MAG: hypothetical protein M3487_11580 [Actinomycetota bacterium]|nr:hypothetical protein [Actinomycetota bacterium]